MKRILKWTGITVLGLVLVFIVSAQILASRFNGKFNQVYELTPEPVLIPTDSASMERGRVLAVGCQDCHSTDLAGEVFFDDPNIGVLPSSNLTRAKGSETEGYTDADFVRAIRHGLNKKGNPLMVMPCESYQYFSDEDLGCLIAYLKSLAPIERSFDERQFTWVSQVMAGAGMFGNLFAYDIIDHEKAKNITAPPISNSTDYGAYMVKITGCMSCHQANLGGGATPDPTSPPAPDISRSGASATWSLEGFTSFFRTGITPTGKEVDGNFMPWKSVGAFSDVEIEALYNYIQSLPPANKE